MLTYVINTSENKVLKSEVLFELVGYNRIVWMRSGLGAIENCAEEILRKQEPMTASEYRVVVLVDFLAFEKTLFPEENQDVVIFDDELSRDGKYIFCMDPLDGSSNIDVNVSIGTIFSVYRRKSPVGQMANVDDFLQKGSEQVAAGYVVYGSSTMLVYTTGNGVNGFTLDTSIGEFCLSHPNIKTPEIGKIYSINEGNYEKFPVGVKKYIKYCQENDKKTGRPYSSRYIGSLVADFHRNLLKGGIFIYPETNSHPNGKLRLLYECNPISFISEQAGGIATDGENRILDFQPDSIHQRVPFYTGSKDMMCKIAEFLKFFKSI